MMKKVFMVAVAGALVLGSCGNKKDFCECITEAMASEDPNAYPEGCDYIKDMSEEEAGKKTMECLGDIFGALGDAFGDMGADMDAAFGEMEAEMADEMPAETEVEGDGGEQ
jgi:hypothetical protein